jgi:hypothetical protein
MRRKKIIESMLLCVLVLSSCMDDTTSFPATTSPYPTATMVVVTRLPTVTRTASAPVLNKTNLSCEIFMEIKLDSLSSFIGLDTPLFDISDNMFAVDWKNERILMYPRGEKTPKVIPLPEFYTPEFLPRTTPYLWRSPTIVSEDRIFFIVLGVKDKREVFRLFALSLVDGNFTTVDLEPYYSPRTPSRARLFKDMNGGVYVLLDNILIHYDKKLHSELFARDDFTNFYYIVRGLDGNLYTQGEPDVVRNWGTTLGFSVDPKYVFQHVHATLPGGKDRSIHYKLVGADFEGLLYFVRYFNLHGETKDEIDIVRFNVQTRTGEVGKITNKEWISYSYDYILAPDGMLYSLIFDPKDSSTQPKVIRCILQ